MAQPFSKLHWSRFVEYDQYLIPDSLDQALAMLAEFGGSARVIAGGTDVVPELRSRKLKASALVDISRLPDMDRMELDDGVIRLGPLATHAQVAASQLIRERAAVLAEGCAWVGSPQIRNVATVGGNLVSGQPAADASLPLLALEAEAAIAGPQGERQTPLADFFLDLGKTAIDPSREILTGISFKALGEHSGGCYQRLAQRKALVLPMLACAAKVKVDPDKQTFAEVALALGPVAPTPLRERGAESILTGQPIGKEIIAKAAASASAQCSPRDSLLRGSCDYRQAMVHVLVERGLTRSLALAGFALS